MKEKLNCIMLIDDDEPTNFISSMLIEQVDCTKHIEVAESGQNALNYLKSMGMDHCGNPDRPCPDIIFLDINMPAMNGWEFLEKYNELQKEQQAKIMIIMLTTSLNPDDELRALKMPIVSGFENKPLTKEKINRVIKQYFIEHADKEPVTT
ncbi:MAG: response regulator [Ferruginibacter sp.]